MNSGTCAAATCSAVVVLQTSSRRMLLPPNVASKYVRAVAPVPPAAAGSSAPESVELTLTRKTLIAGLNSSNGGVARKALTNAVHALLKSFCWAAVKPSAESTTLNARLRGAEPKIWVEPMTAPSAVVMADLPHQRLICSGKLARSVTSGLPGTALVARLAGSSASGWPAPRAQRRHGRRPPAPERQR